MENRSNALDVVASAITAFVVVAGCGLTDRTSLVLLSLVGGIAAAITLWQKGRRAAAGGIAIGSLLGLALTAVVAFGHGTAMLRM